MARQIPIGITDPSGGSNFGILDTFLQFGYTPTQAEIDALAPSFKGAKGTSGEGDYGVSAVAQYVNVKNQQAEFEKNDPLKALETRMNDQITLHQNQVSGLYDQLQSVLSEAPKLFGNMTPDQIGTYLAPLKQSFDAQLASVQGVAASRGIPGSSTENNALAQTDEQFKEKVFSTGLDVGMKSQANRANSIQQQIQNLFGLVGQEKGISGEAASKRSEHMLGQSNLIASLPSFLNAQSEQQKAIMTARDEASRGGFLKDFYDVTNAINQASNTFENLAMIPSQFKSQPTGAQAGMPGFPQGSPNAAPPLFNSSSTPGYTPADQGPLALFQATGSMFGS